MHTIVDEIYALSDRTPEDHPDHFHSVLNQLIPPNPPYTDVHFLWGLSKDLGASGFRFGVLYTHNLPLLLALANLNVYSAVSHPIQLIVADLLSDSNFLSTFLPSARSTLEQSYGICTRKLDEMVVPYVRSGAGLFVYADFSRVLPHDGGGRGRYGRERRFGEAVRDVCGVVMTPGESMGEERPGWFRICYAWVEPEVLEVAMERISRMVLMVRTVGWEELRVAEWRKEVLECDASLSLNRTRPSVNIPDGLSRLHD